jgi:hypothetical protein
MSVSGRGVDGHWAGSSSWCRRAAGGIAWRGSTQDGCGGAGCFCSRSGMTRWLHGPMGPVGRKPAGPGVSGVGAFRRLHFC